MVAAAAAVAVAGKMPAMHALCHAIFGLGDSPVVLGRKHHADRVGRRCGGVVIDHADRRDSVPLTAATNGKPRADTPRHKSHAACPTKQRVRQELAWHIYEGAKRKKDIGVGGLGLGVGYGARRTCSWVWVMGPGAHVQSGQRRDPPPMRRGSQQWQQLVPQDHRSNRTATASNPGLRGGRGRAGAGGGGAPRAGVCVRGCPPPARKDVPKVRAARRTARLNLAAGPLWAHRLGRDVALPAGPEAAVVVVPVFVLVPGEGVNRPHPRPPTGRKNNKRVS